MLKFRLKIHRKIINKKDSYSSISKTCKVEGDTWWKRKLNCLDKKSRIVNSNGKNVLEIYILGISIT